MFKLLLILSIAFSLSGCSWISAKLQKTLPNANTPENPSPSPAAVVTTPEASPNPELVKLENRKKRWGNAQNCLNAMVEWSNFVLRFQIYIF